MLEIKNLHAKAGDKQILNDINLTVNAGEVHAVMGPRGLSCRRTRNDLPIGCGGSENCSNKASPFNTS